MENKPLSRMIINVATLNGKDLRSIPLKDIKQKLKDFLGELKELSKRITPIKLYEINTLALKHFGKPLLEGDGD